MRFFRKLNNLKLGDVPITSTRVEILAQNVIIYGVGRDKFLRASRVTSPCVMEVSGNSYKVATNGAAYVPESLVPEVSNIYLELEKPVGDALYKTEGTQDANRVES